MRWLRESFGAKLLVALLGTVGLLLAITYVVVRSETARQVDVVVERTIGSAAALFEELNELQRQQAARLAAPFTESSRGRAALDEMIENRDYDFLAGDVEYQMQLAGLTDVLLVFTDATGSPVLTLLGGRRITEGDPAEITPLARRLLEGDELVATGYRFVDGRVYEVTALYVDLNYRPIGTIAFGVPIRTEDMDRIGAIGGFEACISVKGRCVAATSGVDAEVGAQLAGAALGGGQVRASAGGREWSVGAVPLDAEDPARGARVVAVALDEVLAPFDRITGALLAGGGGALLLSALLGIALSRNLTRPVRALVAATGRVAEGDYAARVDVGTHDEMGKLAGAFNEMANGLQVRERYRSVLNKVVSRGVADELMKGEVELGGENRLVSVLFADIRGFTALTEGMEPQEVIGLLNECMEQLSQAIDAEGGVVDKFIGDEVMAIFGAPAAQEDHARRAVAAALRMRVHMAGFNAAREA
ncbi:MAG TPA: adenylate/guanylate cyclase domain-containing protein, partial [Longimicrobiales bacterium]|nr:adenylate/guanylate cyclase domain-containing protein [Longimicrobiales bacterium]